MRIAIATCVKLPEPDPDEEVLLAALRAKGADVRMLPWDGADPAQQAAADELVVIRSTWDYYRDLAGFLAWVDRTAAVAKLLNPASILRWNADKRYLRELEGRGIAIVPTAWETTDVAKTVDARGWD